MKGGITMVNLKKVTLRKQDDVRLAKKRIDLVKHTGRKVNLRKEK